MRLRERLWPGLRRRGIVLEVVLALLSWVSIALAVEDAGPLPPDAVVLSAVLLAVLLLLRRRRSPLAVFLASALVTALSPAVTGALAISAYAVGRYEGRMNRRLAAAVVGTIAVVRPWMVAQAALEFVVLATAAALVIVLPGVIGAWVRAREELLVALRDRAEKAEAERELLAREAVLGERTRIAREMHDAVGHRVSLMVLQAGAIEMAARDAERVEQLAGQVQTAGRRALEELRQMVGVLRAGDVDEDAPLGPQPGLEDLPRLVDSAREAGMRVELALGEHAAVEPAVGRAAYRIAQEALTNAGKHAPGARVSVEIVRTADALAVRVVNGPADRVPAGTSGEGYGLVGLGERVRTLGGRLTAEPRLDGGFCVEAVLPA
ncbi:histidine kinase [Blastococcus sp. BMG 814]|uniref:histidine kinase n=1 Tax=Blastococcus carthaginiensis TaxID=3050034 RepID=A0ABT9IGQ4_9ACTN|nr:histidine kinase [Blastococcus carthaginiensis]MDP5184741.1 histidine kinase [Blastococcus carthaginiensis]